MNRKKRIVLVVENLNMLISEQLTNHSDWDLRHTLINEPRLMLLGTATAHFDEIKNIDKAWFELFSIYELKPLTLEECQSLWKNLVGVQLSDIEIQPIKILTGGNPRLVRIFASFAINRSLSELLEQLVQLIDEHTEYFKSQLESLAPTERKVFTTLLDIWDPAGAKDVAKMARLDVNKTSALLNRLVEKGAVQVIEQQGRRKFYQASERLYNIYYLMRRRGHPANRVRAVVSIIIQLFKGERLVQITKLIANESHDLKGEISKEHFWTYRFILHTTKDINLKSQIIYATPEDFVSYLMSSEISKNEKLYYALMRGYSNLLNDNIQQAKIDFAKAIELEPENGSVYSALGAVVMIEGDLKKSQQYFLKALELKPKNETHIKRLYEELHDLIENSEAKLYQLDLLCKSISSYEDKVSILEDDNSESILSIIIYLAATGYAKETLKLLLSVRINGCWLLKL